MKETRLTPGTHISCRARHETRQILAIEQTLFVLQLTRAPKQPQPTREIRLSDGAILREASGDKQASEQVMALAVLGALEDPRGLSEMARFAVDQARDRDARWEAVRQALALDCAAGFELLEQLAVRTDDTLARPAKEMRDRLLQSYPQLRGLSKELV